MKKYSVNLTKYRRLSDYAPIFKDNMFISSMGSLWKGYSTNRHMLRFEGKEYTITKLTREIMDRRYNCDFNFEKAIMIVPELVNEIRYSPTYDCLLRRNKTFKNRVLVHFKEEGKKPYYVNIKKLVAVCFHEMNYHDKSTKVLYKRTGISDINKAPNLIVTPSTEYVGGQVTVDQYEKYARLIDQGYGTYNPRVMEEITPEQFIFIKERSRK